MDQGTTNNGTVRVGGAHGRFSLEERSVMFRPAVRLTAFDIPYRNHCASRPDPGPGRAGEIGWSAIGLLFQLVTTKYGPREAGASRASHSIFCWKGGTENALRRRRRTSRLRRRW